MMSNIQSSRTPSMFSSDYDKDYVARVQHKSDNIVEDDQCYELKLKVFKQ